jgi:hypothetical protein
MWTNATATPVSTARLRRLWTLTGDDPVRLVDAAALAKSRRQIRQQNVEPLWSPVVATDSKRPQMERAQKPRNQAKTVAVGCNQLLRGAHGKEAQTGTRGIDRCGAVLTDDAGPISAAFPRRTYQLLTNVAGRLRSPAYSAGT